MKLVICAPLALPSAANLREHWATRHRRVAKQRADLAMFVSWRPFPLPCVVRLVRVAPRPLDGDNLQAAFKAIRDELALRLGLPDDRDPRVTWEYGQERGRPKEQGLRIEFREAAGRVTPTGEPRKGG